MAGPVAVRGVDDMEYRVSLDYSGHLHHRPNGLGHCRTAGVEFDGEPGDHGRTGIGVFRDPSHSGDRIRCHG